MVWDICEFSGPRLAHGTHLLDLPAPHGAALVNDKDHVLGYRGQVLRGKVVHKVAILDL